MRHPKYSTTLTGIATMALALLFVTGCASLKPVEVVEVSGPDSLLTSEPGRFVATVGPDNATQPVAGTWSFGDGVTAEGFENSHRYTEPGTYTVTFTASNERRKKTSSDMEEFQVVVQRPIQAASIERITFNPTDPDTHSEITFASNVVDDRREASTYAWAFGDGSESTAVTPTHVYADAGTYTVQLTVSNSAGSDSRTVNVNVEPYLAEVCKSLVDMNTAFFDRNSSTLSDDARLPLMENLEILNACPNTCVSVAGYADAGERRADALSAARASAVSDFYADGGVDAERMVAEGMGRAEGASRKDPGAQFRRADSIPMQCVEPMANTTSTPVDSDSDSR